MVGGLSGREKLLEGMAAAVLVTGLIILMLWQGDARTRRLADI